MGILASSQITVSTAKDGENGQTLYATCSTAATVSDKVATLENGSLTLKTGSTVSVKFTSENSVASPTLNVAGTGAKTIFVNGGALTSEEYYWGPNAMVTFVYDGTNWNVSDSAALSKAAEAQNTASEAAKVATNFMEYDSTNGLQIGNKTGDSWSGYRTQIKSDSFNVVDQNGNTLSSFGSNLVELGKNNDTSVISLCNGKAEITYCSDDTSSLFDFVSFETDRKLLFDASAYSLESKNLTILGVTDGTVWPYYEMTYALTAGSGRYSGIQGFGMFAAKQLTLEDGTPISDSDNNISSEPAYSSSFLDIGPSEISMYTSKLAVKGDSEVDGNINTSGLNVSGNIDTSTLNATGNIGASSLNVSGKIDTSGLNVKGGGIELNSSGTLSKYGGFIDFHYNKTSSDYTSRIIEDANGQLNLIASNGVKVNGNIIDSGTWTPVCYSIGSPTQAFGSYTKIGKNVTVSFCIYGASSSSSTNSTSLRITGLPFTPDSSVKWFSGGGNASGVKTSANYAFSGFCIENNATYGAIIVPRCIQTTTSAATRSSSYCTNPGNGTTIYMAGTIMYCTA